ncbi:MAG: hypothetical protein FWD43_05245, partial [Coriobacteriia bacterium]|nr:hypothetical protein [Coriobacteriia bacterium]
MKIPKTRTRFVYIILMALVVFFLAQQFFSNANTQTVEKITTREFETAVENYAVVSVQYNAISGTVEGYYLKDGETDPKKATPYSSTYVDTKKLHEMMADHPEIDFDINVKSSDMLYSILGYAALIVVFGVIIFILFRQFNNANNKQM